MGVEDYEVREPNEMEPVGTEQLRCAGTELMNMNPNSEVADGGWADEALSECARPRAQQLASFSSHGTFPNRLPTLPGCGRDGRTPPTQKFHFGVRDELSQVWQTDAVVVGSWLQLRLAMS